MSKKNKTKKLKLVDLFAGTGAFSYALEKTGKVETVLANDFDENSKKIYDLNFKKKLLLKDLNDISDSKLYKLAGNVVTVTVVGKVANQLIKLL
ncbi:MAG: cytosine-specific methyltransferase [Edafosvirus sp.]|uniref:Cytosine-specific methyltransferase n=1 Tax=Edafosvirus sp. TaxID=2487765 RepID=A0A3G4ZVC4_9VIRU|nr:MAG: cytosine-specific methyltransferase [Edafosvirus sp.]